ncbi:MAG: polymer-forming cytoskeletal protein [Gammaproteobacteria bacterium]|nr:polymer-forming cytoskeletal protein [Gammaproteobacteria bacterium]
MFKRSDNTVNFGSTVADCGESKQASTEPVTTETASSKSAGADRRSLPAVIGASIRIQGELSGDEDLVIQGHVEGSIELKKNNLTVGAQGSLKASCRARIITVEGKVEGDLYGDERIVIKLSGDVRGNIVAPRVSLEDGAKFKGSIDMEPKHAKSGASSDRPAEAITHNSTAKTGKESSLTNAPHVKSA